VTHDQEEALSISDRVVVMNQGRAEQVGAPHEVYNRPTTRFVANFVGTLNTLEAMVVDPALGIVSIGDTAVQLAIGKLALKKNDIVTLALRPEALQLGRQKSPAVTLSGMIEDVQFLGSVIRLRASIAGQSVSLDTFNRHDAAPPAIGSQAKVAFQPSDLILLKH
jgi:putative spermidine/putrescine transport system ATP-binding protein